MLINLEIGSKYASQNALKSLKINEKSLSGLPALKHRIIGLGPFRDVLAIDPQPIYH